ncbi:hypothetical protein E3N88_45446 [Mikania micrantha]|uniref:STAS domain-containing protein n=1 Tax=Mikania micrantha TaxID=192012 RepID=A0A5N6L940_9ASTR|nr:hypothetical protein E3N88_45446 [Mikania micrantha]
MADELNVQPNNAGYAKTKAFWGYQQAAPLASVILSTLLVTLFRSKLHGHCNCSFSRSAVNANAGAKTVVSNIIMASTVLVTLLFLMPLFHYTPNLILAAIIITAVIGLIDYQSAIRLWKVDKLDFLACLSSFLGVLMISVPIGWGFSFKILLHVTRPNTGVLGNIPGTQIYQNVNRYREAKRVPSFAILGIEAPIYFANSTYLQERYDVNSLMLKVQVGNASQVVETHVFCCRILRWIREEEDWLAANNGSSLRCVIIDMTAVTGIDTSGLAMMKDLKRMLEKRSLQLVLANPGGSVTEKLHQSNILESFGLEGVYLTIDEAVADISSSWKSQP